MAHSHSRDGGGLAPPAAGRPDPLQAFRLIDATLGASAQREYLLTLRKRLTGELIGAPELVDATLAADFELVTHAQGTTARMDREAVIASAGGQGTSLVWLELADLATGDRVIAGHGVLRQALGPVLATAPLAFFIRFDGVAMTSEVLYLEAARESALPPDAAMPSRDRLGDLLGLDYAGLDHGKGRRWS